MRLIGTSSPASGRSSVVVRALLAAALAALVLPAGASAAMLYAAPDGVSTGSCPESAPCDLAYAVSSAASGDEVRLSIVRDGSGEVRQYQMGTALTVSQPNITISGPEGRRSILREGPGIIWPDESSVLASRFTPVPNNQSKLVVNADGLTLERLAVLGTVTGGSYLIGSGSTHDGMTMRRTIVFSRGDGVAVLGTDLNIADSMIFQGEISAPVPSASVAVAATGGIHGSTIISFGGIATENSTSYHAPAANNDLNILNTISASISLAGGKDLSVFDEPGGATPHVGIDYSWIDSSRTSPSLPTPLIAYGGHNLPSATPPVLDPYFPVPTSPTIDAGCDDVAIVGAGPCDNDYDLDGRPRPIGAHKDIGAYERPFAPSFVTPVASALTRSGVKLTGSVNPNGEVTAYHFSYRKASAASWTNEPAQSLTDAAENLPVIEEVTGLSPATNYVARITANNVIGGATSSTVAFRTAAPSNYFTAAKAKAKISRSAITLTTAVTVPGAGKITQLATTKKGTRRTTRCKATKTSTRRGTYRVSCKVGRAGRSALRKAKMVLTLRTSFRPTGGALATKTQSVKLQRRR